MMGRAAAAVHVCALLAMLGAAPLLRGDTLVVVTSAAAQGANDSVVWSQLGADATTLSSAFVATSTQGIGVTVDLTGANSLKWVVPPHHVVGPETVSPPATRCSGSLTQVAAATVR